MSDAEHEQQPDGESRQAGVASSSWHPTRSEIAEAALAMLADADLLESAGLSINGLHRATGFERGTIRHHFGRQHAIEEIVDALLVLLREARERVTSWNLASLGHAVEELERGGPQHLADVARVSIAGTIQSFASGELPDPERRRRHALLRLYLLALAQAEPGVEHPVTARLRALVAAEWERIDPVYERGLAAVGRAAPGGIAGVRHAIASYLEGVASFRRLGLPGPDDDEVAITMMRIAHALSAPAGDHELPSLAHLYGNVGVVGDGTYEVLDCSSLLSAFAAGIERLPPGTLVRDCFIAQEAGLDPAYDRLRAAVEAFLARGGRVQRLTAVRSSADLALVLADAERAIAAGCRLELRALADPEALPALVSTTVGDRFGGTRHFDRYGELTGGVLLRGREGVGLLADVFLEAYDEPGSHAITSGRGLDPDGIEAVRRELAAAGGAGARR